MADMTAIEMLGEADIEAYRRDGVVCLREAISAEWIEALRAGVEAALAARPMYYAAASEFGVVGYDGNLYTSSHTTLESTIPDWVGITFTFDRVAAIPLPSAIRASRRDCQELSGPPGGEKPLAAKTARLFRGELAGLVER